MRRAAILVAAVVWSAAQPAGAQPAPKPGGAAERIAVETAARELLASHPAGRFFEPAPEIVGRWRDQALFALRHRPSGGRCVFVLGAENSFFDFERFGDGWDVACISVMVDMFSVTHLTRYPEPPSGRLALRWAMAETRQHYSDVLDYHGRVEELALLRDGHPWVPPHSHRWRVTGVDEEGERRYIRVALVRARDWVVKVRVNAAENQALEAESLGENLFLLSAVALADPAEGSE